VPINHYIEVDFLGFAGIVDALGGVEMTFPYPARDRKSGFEIGAGKQTLSGRQAVAYARSRSYQELRDGAWVFVDTNDINRTARQRDLLMAIVTQIDVPSSLGEFNEIVSGFADFVATDPTFDADDVIELAWNMRSIDPGDMDSLTLPVVISEEGGVSYVVPVEPDATQALAALRDGEPFAETVIGTPVIAVQNGNDTAGSAASIAEFLESAGFQVASVTNSGRDDYEVTQVVARPNKLPEAEAVVAALGYGEAVAGATPSDVDVVVIVGRDGT
jgi:anionic cell wall polymer biosynthesis LytR-Cps2A-Psr (LCP) family protein